MVTGRFAEFTVGEFEDFLVAQAEWFLGEIHALGAHRVTFAGLSPIGCLQLERTLNALRGGCVEEYNQVARDYNAKVLDMLRRLMAARPGLKAAREGGTAPVSRFPASESRRRRRSPAPSAEGMGPDPRTE